MGKKSEKKVRYIIISIFIILVLISLVSAEFSDWIKTITGKAAQNLTITVTGPDPIEIVYVSLAGGSVSPNEFPLQTTVKFNVHVLDPNGKEDINDSSVFARLSSGTTQRENSCIKKNTDMGDYTLNFSCTIDLWSWDPPSGTWDINISGKDYGNGSTQYNDTGFFNYAQTSYFVIDNEVITWTPVSIGELNYTPSNFVTINNTGNYNKNISITALDLQSATYSNLITADNFTVGNDGTNDAQCLGFNLQDSLAVDTNIYTNPGNLSKNDGSGQSYIYYCIPLFPDVPSSIYTTDIGGSWSLEF